jgi:hypothetical protein
MRLSEWTKAASTHSGGGESFARRAAGEALQGLFEGQDPMVFGHVEYGQSGNDPFVVTLWAPMSAGLAKATVEHGPHIRPHRDPHVDVEVQPWVGTAGTVRLAMAGNPEDGPLPVILRIAGAELTSTTRGERGDLLAFYEAVAALAK